MNILNVLIATTILCGLRALVVTPLWRYLVAQKLRQPAYAGLAEAPDLDTNQATLGELVTAQFILADVLVLGIAGLLGGLLGFWFVGISFEKKGWPGIIAFAAASFLGLGLRGLAPSGRL